MRDEQNKKQGCCCSFFKVVIDYFSPCYEKKTTQNRYNSFDTYEKELFDESPTCHDLSITPRPGQMTKANAANATYHYVELPTNNL